MREISVPLISPKKKSSSLCLIQFKFQVPLSLTCRNEFLIFALRGIKTSFNFHTEKFQGVFTKNFFWFFFLLWISIEMINWKNFKRRHLNILPIGLILKIELYNSIFEVSQHSIFEIIITNFNNEEEKEDLKAFRESPFYIKRESMI